MRTATAPPSLVLRIHFVSGIVREERGTEAQLQQLFIQDQQSPPRVVDHCLTWDPSTGQQDLFLHADDPRLS